VIEDDQQADYVTLYGECGDVAGQAGRESVRRSDLTLVVSIIVELRANYQQMTRTDIQRRGLVTTGISCGGRCFATDTNKHRATSEPLVGGVA